MGILGPKLTRQGEKMRPDLGFGKSIFSPVRVPFQLLRECDEVEEPAQPEDEGREGGTVLETVEEEGEQNKEVVGSGRPGQVIFLCVVSSLILFIHLNSSSWRKVLSTRTKHSQRAGMSR